MPRVSKQLYEKALVEKRVPDHTMTVEAVLDGMTPEQYKNFQALVNKTQTLFNNHMDDMSSSDKSTLGSVAKIFLKNNFKWILTGGDAAKGFVPIYDNDEAAAKFLPKHQSTVDLVKFLAYLDPKIWTKNPELAWHVREVLNTLKMPLPVDEKQVTLSQSSEDCKNNLTDQAGDPENIRNMLSILANRRHNTSDEPARYYAFYKDTNDYEDVPAGMGTALYEEVNSIDQSAEVWKLQQDKELMEFLKTERALQAAKEGNLEASVEVNVYLPRQRAERERQEQQDKERAEREAAERREREHQEYERELAEKAKAASAKRSAERAPKLEAMLRKFGYTDEELAADAPKKVSGSTEYRRMVAELFNGYKDAKLNKYSLQNDKDIVNACIAYNKGKKSVRTFESGRERFDLSLHLMATVADPRDPDVQANIARINEVRKVKPGDPNYVDLANYGAEKAGDPTLREAQRLFDKKRNNKRFEGFTKEELDEIRGKIGEGLHTIQVDGKEVPDPNARLSFDEANDKIAAATKAIRTRKAEAERRAEQRAADEKAAAEKQHREALAKLEAEERVKAEAEAKKVRAAANVKINAAERAVQNDAVIDQVQKDVAAFEKQLTAQKKREAIKAASAAIEDKWKNFDEKSHTAAMPGNKAHHFVSERLKEGNGIVTQKDYSDRVAASGATGTGVELAAQKQAVAAILMTKVAGPDDEISDELRKQVMDTAYKMVHTTARSPKSGRMYPLFYDTELANFNSPYGFLSDARSRESNRKWEKMVLDQYNQMVEKGEIDPVLPVGVEPDPISGAEVHEFLSKKGVEAVKQFKELEKDHNPENPMTPEMIRAHETAVRYCVADNMLKQDYPNAKGPADVAAVMKKADEFIKRPSMLNALGSLPLDKNFNLAIGKVCVMDKQATMEQAEANRRLTADYGAPQKKEEAPVAGA